MSRTSLYLAPAEDADLRKLAAETGVAFNTLIRICVRRLVGREIPAWADELLKQSEEEQG